MLSVTHLWAMDSKLTAKDLQTFANKVATHRTEKYQEYDEDMKKINSSIDRTRNMIIKFSRNESDREYYSERLSDLIKKRNNIESEYNNGRRQLEKESKDILEELSGDLLQYKNYLQYALVPNIEKTQIAWLIDYNEEIKNLQEKVKNLKEEERKQEEYRARQRELNAERTRKELAVKEREKENITSITERLCELPKEYYKTYKEEKYIEDMYDARRFIEGQEYEELSKESQNEIDTIIEDFFKEQEKVRKIIANKKAIDDEKEREEKREEEKRAEEARAEEARAEEKRAEEKRAEKEHLKALEEERIKKEKERTLKTAIGQVYGQIGLKFKRDAWISEQYEKMVKLLGLAEAIKKEGGEELVPISCFVSSKKDRYEPILEKDFTKETLDKSIQVELEEFTQILEDIKMWKSDIQDALGACEPDSLPPHYNFNFVRDLWAKPSCVYDYKKNRKNFLSELAQEIQEVQKYRLIEKQEKEYRQKIKYRQQVKEQYRQQVEERYRQQVEERYRQQVEERCNRQQAEKQYRRA